MRSSQLDNLLDLARLSTNIGKAVCRKGLALVNLPINILLKEHKKIPDPPPYATPLIDVIYNFIWHVRFRSNNHNALLNLEKRAKELLLSQSKPYGLGPVIKVPRVTSEELNCSDWNDIYEGFPVIIDGFMKDSPAVKQWSLDFMKKNYGGTKVFVQNQGTSLSHNNYGNSSEMITMSELVGSIRNGGRKYLTASSNLFKENKELLDDLNLDHLEAYFGHKIIRVEIFMGGKQVGAPFHCAPGGNLFCQIHGEKQWVLVSPKHTKWMYPNIGFNNNGVYSMSPIRSDDQRDIDKRYPLYKYIPKYIGHLKPGDLLYNPPWWWHEVTNVNETIGIPIRIRTNDDLNHWSHLFMSLTSPAFKSLLVPALKRSFSPTGELFLNDDYFARAATHGKVTRRRVSSK